MKEAHVNTAVIEATRRLLDCVESADYAGYDPYDALNSPVIHRICSRSRLAALGATQFFRRCPLNLRPILGVPEGHNPKGIGLFLWGYVKLYRIDRQQARLERIQHLLDLLEKLKSTGYSGNCWGYNFDWRSRTLYAPRFTPTIVNSAWIGHALLDAHEHAGLSRALDMAVSIKDFFLKDLDRMADGSSFCFSYTPLDQYAVHNANLLGASLLVRLAGVTGDTSLQDPALSALAYSMKHQRADGSWPYSERDGFGWIDSFHTGFNLQAVRCFLDAGLAPEYWAAYRKGVEYYAANFFLENGTPKYYSDRIYPIDIHSPAQAISFFSRECNAYQDLAEKIVCWMLKNMYDGRGHFYFRKGRFLTNRICYMRWSQAWAFHALTEYMLQSYHWNRAVRP
jgi:hypothetical protein